MRVTVLAKADRAELVIYEDIGEGWFGGLSAKTFSKELKSVGSVKEIDVRLNSGGGDVFDGLAIYRQLVDHSATIRVHVDGLAASIASVIAMAGASITMAESSFMMIHDAWGVAMGSAADIRRTADLLDSTTTAIADVYRQRTGRKLGEINQWMAAETWMTSAEALERGFATTLAPSMKIAARLDTDKHRFRNAPPLLTAGRQRFDTASGRVAAMRAALADRGKQISPQGVA